MTNPLNDKDGKSGLLRISVAFIIFTWFGVWAFVSIETMTMQPISIEEVMLLLGSVTAKAVQSVKT